MGRPYVADEVQLFAQRQWQTLAPPERWPLLFTMPIRERDISNMPSTAENDLSIRALVTIDFKEEKRYCVVESICRSSAAAAAGGGSGSGDYSATTSAGSSFHFRVDCETEEGEEFHRFSLFLTRHVHLGVQEFMALHKPYFRNIYIPQNSSSYGMETIAASHVYECFRACQIAPIRYKTWMEMKRLCSKLLDSHVQSWQLRKKAVVERGRRRLERKLIEEAEKMQRGETAGEADSESTSERQKL